MKYKTLLFDADNTLLDFSRSEKEAIHDIFMDHGYDLNDEQLKLYASVNDGYWKKLEVGLVKREDLYWMRFEDFCKEIKADISAKVLAYDYLTALSKKSYLMKDAEKLCASLYGKCRMYVITNGNAVVQEHRFGKSSIAKYFEDSFISEVIGCDKPDIKFFEAVFKKIPDFVHEETLVIGDSLSSDIKGGINSSLDTCWFTPKDIPIPKEFEGKITYRVTELMQVLDILKE